MNADGSNVKLLSKADSAHGHDVALGGGAIIDSLPAEDGVVLLARPYHQRRSRRQLASARAPRDSASTASTRARSGASASSRPGLGADDYITDGRGEVRIVGVSVTATANTTSQASGITDFLYREPDSQDWHKLGEYNSLERTGFNPRAVDPGSQRRNRFQEKPTDVSPSTR